METATKQFIVILYPLVLAIWIYLLLLQKINGWELTALVLVSTVATAILYNLDNITSIVARPQEGEFRVEMRELKEDIYAKANEVQKMGEEVADIVAFNISHVGRLAPENLDGLLVEHRDKLVVMLKKIKSSQQRIEEITEQINKMVLYDLANHAIETVNEIVSKKDPQRVRLDRAKIIEETRQYFKSYELGVTRNKVTEYLKDIDCYSTEIENKLDQYEYFLTNKKLKQ